jgi:hypothetical protein
MAANAKARIRPVLRRSFGICDGIAGGGGVRMATGDLRSGGINSGGSGRPLISASTLAASNAV